MIDYARLDRSIQFYEKFGFQRIELPWTVTKAVSNITKPPGGKEWEIIGKDKVLVASGEQGFLYLKLYRRYMFKSIDINFNLYDTSICFHIPKFSKILDIEIFENSLLKIFYESNGDQDLKTMYLKLILIDNTTTINESMKDYEFFKTVTNNSMYLDSSGRVLTQEFISEKYLVFINFNMCVDEIRNDRLNQIINE